MTKKLMLWLGISLVCFTAFVLSARAVEKETVSLTNVDGQIEAALELPEMPAEEIVALQLSFQIGTAQGSIGKEDVSFAFDAGLPGDALQQCRYQEDTGILTIYISGNQNLYPKGNEASSGNPKLSLGRVIVNSDRDASVKVVKNSFKTVNKAHGMYEGEVNTGDGGQIINNGSTDKDVVDNPGQGEMGGNFGTPDEGVRPSDEGDKSEASDKEGILTADRKEKNAFSMGAAGSLKGILGTVSPEKTSGEMLASDRDGENREAPVIPEDSLWQEGAKLWREKTGSIDMEVWTKIFFGLFAASASVASVIGTSLAVQASKRRKKRRKRRTHARRNDWPPVQVRSASRRQPGRPSQRSLPRTGEKLPVKGQTVKRYTKAASVRKNQPVRKTQPVRKIQGKSPYSEHPVWKDDNKSYVRKRRKIS